MNRILVHVIYLGKLGQNVHPVNSEIGEPLWVGGRCVYSLDPDPEFERIAFACGKVVF